MVNVEPESRGSVLGSLWDHDIPRWWFLMNQAGTKDMFRIGLTGSLDGIQILNSPSPMFDATGQNDQQWIPPQRTRTERLYFVEGCLANFNLPGPALGWSPAALQDDHQAGLRPALARDQGPRFPEAPLAPVTIIMIEPRWSGVAAGRIHRWQFICRGIHGGMLFAIQLE